MKREGECGHWVDQQWRLLYLPPFFLAHRPCCFPRAAENFSSSLSGYDMSHHMQATTK